MGAVEGAKFAQLVALGKLITDYASPEEAAVSSAGRGVEGA